MGLRPLETKNLFVLENGFEPKKPLLAERGDGCTEEIM